MKLLQLSPTELRRKLGGPGVWLRTGPFSVRVYTDLTEVAQGLARLYSHFEARCTHESAADFEVAVRPPSPLRRWLRPQVSFSADGEHPFGLRSREEAYTLFEQGLDWCVARRANRYLVLRAAAVSRQGRAAILCAPPRAGVSTLTAALALSGWRLLADGLTLIDRQTGLVRGLPRPIRLKNASVDLIRTLAPDAVLHVAGRSAPHNETAYLRPPRDSVVCQHDPAHLQWIIFPHWRGDVPTTLTQRPSSETMRGLAASAFDGRALDTVDAQITAALVASAVGHDLHYSALADAVAALDHLAKTP